MSNDARQQEEQTTLRRARLLNLPYADTSIADADLYPQILSVPDLYQLKAIPIQADQNNIVFGITNTTSQATMTNLQQRFADQRVSFALISDTGFRDLMRRYDPPKQIVYQDISLINQDESDQIGSVSDILNTVRADDLLAFIVRQAYKLQASDIHLETEESDVRIRFRVDGVLHPVAVLTLEKYRQLISSLAIAANISTSSPDAQTGHINKTYQMADGTSVTVNLRVESVPTVYGMDAVLRLFNMKPELMNIENLGLGDSDRAIIEDIITHPNGLVLIVGPTGSGKTTTLYSLLNELNDPERKIITLEDPVEYYVRGITQIPVDSRQDANGFADKFRAVLRLDPDVIMVGEIRDNDTAKTALQSALTGHLVLSTYHARSATAALTRLLDSIGDNPLFSSAVRLVTAQRLVRRLDDETKEAYKPDAKLSAWIDQVVSTLPPQIEKPNIGRLKLYRPGYSEQNPYGYNGQFALRELLLMTDSLLEELRKPAHEITTAGLEQAAVADGMATMLQDGVLRVIAGETSIEEVMRVLA